MNKKVLQDIVRLMFKKKNKKLKPRQDRVAVNNLIVDTPLSISEIVDRENQTVQPHRVGTIVEAWSRYQCGKDTQWITTMIFNATRRVYAQKITYTNAVSNTIVESSFVVKHMRVTKDEYRELVKDLARSGYTKRTLIA